MRIIQIATAQDGVCYVVECDEDGTVTMFEDGDQCSDEEDPGTFESMKAARDEADRLCRKRVAVLYDEYVRRFKEKYHRAQAEHAAFDDYYDDLTWRTEAHPTTKTT